MTYRPTPMSEADPHSAQDLVLAGFGGQGVLLAGRLLGNAVLRSGLNVQVNNFYQGFVRGGVSECTIVMSVNEIDAPASRPDVVAVLDNRAAQSWTDRVRPGGLLIRNSSLIGDTAWRDDVNIFDIPLSDIASAVGNSMCASMVVVGALAPLTGAYLVEDCLDALSDVVPSHRKGLIDMNREALLRGAAFAAEHSAGVSTNGTY